MKPLAVYLWCLDLQVEPGLLASCQELLDADERERARRLVFDRDRRRYLVHHAAARLLVSRVSGVPARQLRWAPGPRGRPAVAGLPLALSLSRSQERGLVAIAAEGRVGVDLEAVQERVAEPAWLAGHVDADALAREAAGAPDSSSDWFYRGWTRVEALAKARGTGIALEPASGWDPWRVSEVKGLADDQGQQRDWQVRDVEISAMAGMAYRAAVAADRAPEPVSLHRLSAASFQDWLDAEIGCPGLCRAAAG